MTEEDTPTRVDGTVVFIIGSKNDVVGFPRNTFILNQFINNKKSSLSTEVTEDSPITECLILKLFISDNESNARPNLKSFFFKETKLSKKSCSR